MTTTHPAKIDDSEARVTTVIADDLEIKGSISFKSSLMIKGYFEGEIFSEGLLIVGPTATVKATITTSKLITYGNITGNVIAGDNVVLKSKSCLQGDITTPNIIIENGSIFNGSCIMKKEYTPPSPQPKEVERTPPLHHPFDYKGHTTTTSETPALESTKESDIKPDAENLIPPPTSEENIKPQPVDNEESSGSKKKGFWGR